MKQNKPRRSACCFSSRGERLWNADRDIDWDRGAQIPDAKRASWLRIINTFHGLEVMGLDTIQVMMGQATHQLRNPSLNLYLAAQCQDEARHVYVLDRYLTEVNGHGYMSAAERFMVDRFGAMASWGFFRVENWLISTLFSENFAALFLQQALEIPDIDPLAKQIFRLIPARRSAPCELPAHDSAGADRRPLTDRPRLRLADPDADRRRERAGTAQDQARRASARHRSRPLQADP